MEENPIQQPSAGEVPPIASGALEAPPAQPSLDVNPTAVEEALPVPAPLEVAQVAATPVNSIPSRTLESTGGNGVVIAAVTTAPVAPPPEVVDLTATPNEVVSAIGPESAVPTQAVNYTNIGNSMEAPQALISAGDPSAHQMVPGVNPAAFAASTATAAQTPVAPAGGAPAPEPPPPLPESPAAEISRAFTLHIHGGTFEVPLSVPEPRASVAWLKQAFQAEAQLRGKSVSVRELSFNGFLVDDLDRICDVVSDHARLCAEGPGIEHPPPHHHGDESRSKRKYTRGGHKKLKVVAYVLESYLPEMMQTAEKERQKFYAKMVALPQMVAADVNRDEIVSWYKRARKKTRLGDEGFENSCGENDGDGDGESSRNGFDNNSQNGGNNHNHSHRQHGQSFGSSAGFDDTDKYLATDSDLYGSYGALAPGLSVAVDAQPGGGGGGGGGLVGEGVSVVDSGAAVSLGSDLYVPPAPAQAYVPPAAPIAPPLGAAPPPPAAAPPPPREMPPSQFIIPPCRTETPPMVLETRPPVDNAAMVHTEQQGQQQLGGDIYGQQGPQQLGGGDAIVGAPPPSAAGFTSIAAPLQKGAALAPVTSMLPHAQAPNPTLTEAYQPPSSAETPPLPYTGAAQPMLYAEATQPLAYAEATPLTSNIEATPPVSYTEAVQPLPNIGAAPPLVYTEATPPMPPSEAHPSQAMAAQPQPYTEAVLPLVYTAPPPMPPLNALPTPTEAPSLSADVLPIPSEAPLQPPAEVKLPPESYGSSAAAPAAVSAAVTATDATIAPAEVVSSPTVLAPNEQAAIEIAPPAVAVAPIAKSEPVPMAPGEVPGDGRS